MPVFTPTDVGRDEITLQDLYHSRLRSDAAVQILIEDAPTGSSFLSNTARRAIWFFGSGAFKLLYAAETGSMNVILSQNMTVVAEYKVPPRPILPDFEQKKLTCSI